MEATYNYSATKVDGRFSGSVSFGGQTIGTFEDIRTIRGVKGVAKSIAESHRRGNKPLDNHYESHSTSGTFEL